MRTIPSDLQAKLDSGVTTLCRCWLITRHDGVTQGFTDHDEDVVLDGVTCRAGSGLDGSEVTQHFGLAVGRGWRRRVAEVKAASPASY